MPLILERYPDAKIYTTGIDLLNLTFKDKLKLTSYQKYIIRLIKKYNLEKCVKFLGMLDADQMKKTYLNANCFVLCSSIENESNALGEAMILGVPSVASLCGGVVSKVVHNFDSYTYPFNESYMLAYYVNKIFDSKENYEISKNAIKSASLTYNREKNQENLIKIYNKVAKLNNSGEANESK
jgi:glycosyltransferase involved in cell wall biosynthesis